MDDHTKSVINKLIDRQRRITDAKEQGRNRSFAEDGLNLTSDL